MNAKTNFFFLNKFNELSLNRGSLLSNVNGVFIGVFAPVLTLILNSVFSYRVLLAILVILFAWRVYIHYIDREIIDIYESIVHCERQINDGIDKQVSLQEKLKSKQSIFNRGQFSLDLFAIGIMIYLCFEYFLSLQGYQLHDNSAVLLAAVMIIGVFCCLSMWWNIEAYYKINSIVESGVLVKAS